MTTTHAERPPFHWLTEDSRTFLQRGYLLEGVTAEQRIREICEYTERKLGIEGYADKLYDYMSRGWISLSSPVWANYGLNRGLPISCFGSYIPDSMEGILDTYAEVGMMNKTGGGTSIYGGAIRPRGSKITNNGKSDGSFNFLKMYDTLIDVVSQGTCYEEGTEVLTNNGFKDFRDIKPGVDLLAQVGTFGSITFTSEYELVTQDYQGVLYNFISTNKCKPMRVAVTPNHRMVIERRNDLFGWLGIGEIVKAEDLIPDGQIRFHTTGKAHGDYHSLTPLDSLRLIHYLYGAPSNDTNRVCLVVPIRSEAYDLVGDVIKIFGFKHDVEHHEDNAVVYIDRSEFADIVIEKNLTWVELDKVSTSWINQCFAILFDYANVSDDGCVRTLSVPDKTTADILQALATLGNHTTEINVDENGQYWVNVTYDVKIPGSHVEVTKTPYNGKVYCAVVPTGRLLIRSHGHTLVCGNTRKGQLAAYIDVEHADIHEWLDIRTEGNPVQLIYWGVCIGNQWWDEMKAGDKHKKEIWAKIINRRRRTGVPYIFWKDNVNQQKPEVYKDKNMEIFASNLCCFVGETKVVVQVKPGENVPENAIYTREMTMREIAEHFDKGDPYPIYAKSLPAVNGRWYNTAFDTDSDQHYKLITSGIKTKNSDVVKVTLNDGTTFECTDDHQLALRDGGYVQTKDAVGQVLKGYPSFGGWTPIQDLDKDGFEVLSVEPSREHVAVYDITVEDNHNFYIVDKTTKSEILVHNCEIALPSNEDESFVCCLSSMNLLHFDEWKDTDAVKTLTYFLDCVMSDFIEKGKSIKHLARAVRFAERHRALGIGVLGWHSYLQSKMIPFESFEAMMLNNNIFKIMREKAYEASKELAQRYGEPEVLKGYGRRNTTLLAVAPTKSSSAILGGVSPSIEPYKSNYYVKDLAKLKTVFRNPYLEALLREKGKNTDEVWEDILKHDGSVQHLDFLTKEEKDVFKTFSEISQLTVIQQAGQRQKYIDQGQSLNVMIHPDTPLMDIHTLYETSKELGVKGLYYQIGISSAQAYARELLTSCASCEG